MSTLRLLTIATAIGLLIHVFIASVRDDYRYHPRSPITETQKLILRCHLRGACDI